MRLVDRFGGRASTGIASTCPCASYCRTLPMPCGHSARSTTSRRLGCDRGPPPTSRRRGRARDRWLELEDTGVGMSTGTLSGHLLDFGRSYWESNRFCSSCRDCWRKASRHRALWRWLLFRLHVGRGRPRYVLAARREQGRHSRARVQGDSPRGPCFAPLATRSIWLGQGRASRSGSAARSWTVSGLEKTSIPLRPSRTSAPGWPPPWRWTLWWRAMTHPAKAISPATGGGWGWTAGRAPREASRCKRGSGKDRDGPRKTDYDDNLRDLTCRRDLGEASVARSGGNCSGCDRRRRPASGGCQEHRRVLLGEPSPPQAAARHWFHLRCSPPGRPSRRPARSRVERREALVAGELVFFCGGDPGSLPITLT